MRVPHRAELHGQPSRHRRAGLAWSKATPLVGIGQAVVNQGQGGERLRDRLLPIVGDRRFEMYQVELERCSAWWTG
jgi:hypothetical protein